MSGQQILTGFDLPVHAEWMRSGNGLQTRYLLSSLRQRDSDAADNFRKARVAPESIESGIHPDKRHSTGSLLEALAEPEKSFVCFSKSGINCGDVVARGPPGESRAAHLLGSPFVAGDHSVTDVDHAVGVLGDVGLMSNQHNGIALCVEFGK